MWYWGSFWLDCNQFWNQHLNFGWSPDQPLIWNRKSWKNCEKLEKFYAIWRLGTIWKDFREKLMFLTLFLSCSNILEILLILSNIQLKFWDAQDAITKNFRPLQLQNFEKAQNFTKINRKSSLNLSSKNFIFFITQLREKKAS